jgi:hypothetical protein
MKVLEYKEIVFDDFEQDENGNYWAEICQECAQKYQEKIATEIDDGGTARGICGVAGCCNDGNDAPLHFYIDFPKGQANFAEIDSVEELEYDWH